MLRDVTHERELETDLLESERLTAVKQLAAGVAHEIGNPLNSLGIHLQLLERELKNASKAEPEHLQELVGVARDEVSRLDLIISQFLGALRPAAPVFVKGDVVETLKEALQTLRSEIENRKVEVVLKMKRDLPEVHVDTGQMKQVFFNLIKNAFQAMPGGGKLTVEFDADDRNVTVSIRDTGTGIPEDEFRRLFEPYRTTKASGHGLGLMIVQRIVQDHGGQIEVASKKGKGTVFRIVLPLAERRIRMLK
jgi:signal transduction histidine kinase